MADARESLAARFKRVLGRSIVDEDQDDSTQPGGTSKSKASGSSRRREQVLNAQRTHRNRTQQYIRELEKEVFRLRDENEALRSHMTRMKETVTAAGGAAFLDGLTSPPPQRQQDSRQQSEFSFTSPSSNSPTVSIDLTGLGTVSPEYPCGKRAGKYIPPAYEAPAFTPNPPRVIATRPSAQNGREGELTAQIGINFVLTLESPCLAHVKHSFKRYDRGILAKAFTVDPGPGHSLTATSMLAHRYREHNIENEPLELPSEEIERLLEASARLRLDGEVTPVQIWQRVKEMGKQRGYHATGEELEVLIEEFGKYTYCNSFGAVVQKETAETILDGMFETTG